MTIASDTATGPDLSAVKEKQQKMWASGDFHVVANGIVLVSEHLVDTADIRAGWRVLDVATGSGNAALAAARVGARAVGVDYVPALLERGRERAASEQLDVVFLDGDAEAIPVDDGSFDAVTTVFGSMFAPNQEQAASELVRVVRSGGTIALANWRPDGFLGRMLKTVSGHVPPPPGVRSPLEWGSEERLAELFGGEVSEIVVSERTHTFRAESPQHFVEIFRRWYGPTLKAFEALDEAGQAALEADLVALVQEFDRLDGPEVAIPATYVEVVAKKR
jgi:ubiquinone/menaquinone biosynthesis C-methylase UbiE